MSKFNECRIDPIQNKIIVSKRFLKAAGMMNSSEYKILQQARLENPGFAVVPREIKKPETKNTYRNLSFKNMELHIRERFGETSQEMKAFLRVVELSKVQQGPYAYVKSWFLKNYPDYRDYTGDDPASAEGTPHLTVVSTN